MTLPQQQSIRVHTDLNLLPQVLAWFDQFNRSPVPYAIWLECQLALAEGFTNAVRHAHANRTPDTPIEIEVTLEKQAITIKIWDYGPGFDLDQLLNHSITEQNAEHGRGLKIIQRVADALCYDQIEQRNCLLMVKEFVPD